MTNDSDSLTAFRVGYPFSEADSKDAFDLWGANCGPNSLAFALQRPIGEIRGAIPGFEDKGFCSPTMMKAGLKNLGRSYFDYPFPRVVAAMFAPCLSLVRIQWTGPWTKEGANPKWAYRQTHWIVAWLDGEKRMVFDCNGGIRTVESWEKEIVPVLTACYPRADGDWFPTHIWRIPAVTHDCDSLPPGILSPQLEALREENAALRAFVRKVSELTLLHGCSKGLPMNRRNFLTTAASAVATALVPSWIIPEKRPSHGIDLSAFCHNGPWEEKYAMRVPFVQDGVIEDKIGRKPWQQKLGLPGSLMEPFRYAGNCSCFVRVPIHPGDVIGREQVNLPPVLQLNWTHDWPYRGRWLPWPKANYLLAADSYCLRCFGTGDIGGIPQECEECGGTGHEWVGSGYEPSRPIQCRSCGGLGHHVNEPCPDFKGKPIGVFPDVQRLADCYVAADYHHKITALPGAEYFVPESGTEEKRPIKFRFHGGHGLLMALNAERTEERLTEATR